MRVLLFVFLVGCGDNSSSQPPDAFPPAPDARADGGGGLDAPTDAGVDGRIDAPPPGPPTFGILSGGGLSQDSTLRMQVFIGEVQIGRSADGTMSVEWGLAGRSVAP